VTTPFESQWNSDIYLPERGKLPPLQGGGPYLNGVAPGYFATMGTALVRGRDFTDADTHASPLVAVINDVMARTVWPGRDPLGACFRIEADTVPCTTVIGIVRNSRITTLKDAPQPQYYLPISQWSPGMRVMFIRMKGAPEQGIALIRSAMQGLSDRLPYADVRTMGEILEPELRSWRGGATMFGIFGVLAFVVAILGTYSVVAYDVSRRRREIGVRMALGAQRAQVLRSVIGDGVRRAGIGVAAGLALALLATRFMTDLLFETSPREPSVYVGVAVLLLAAAAAASLVPARQASRLDPVEALRSD
jgi:predicted permease